MSSQPLRRLARAFPFPAGVLLFCVACTGQTHLSANETNFNGSEIHFSASATHLLVCNKGNGSFSGKLPKGISHAGVTVSVGAAMKNKFALRACQAKLTWNHRETVVTPEAAQADIDVMGADLGLGSLVVAFQIKAKEDDPHIRYEIYSLNEPPQLLKTITGEDYFSAADTRLNGSVEIWTTDAAAIDGFEGLPRSAFDVVPTVVLRFERKKLIDVSSEFQPHFDRQIALLRSQLDAQQLSDFKSSDGKLSDDHLPTKDQLHGLVATKIKVLEIVWCYLYSGREQEAWDVLARMWPPPDLDRIRISILSARTRGLRSQVDGVSQNPPLLAQFKSSIIYVHDLEEGFDVPIDQRDKFTDTAPRQVVVQISPPRNPKDWGEEREMELVIDEAGKVRSARMQEEPDQDWSARMKEEWLAKLKEEPNKDWIDSSAGWKYIPAFKDGRPKAFRLKLHVQRDR
jgi:hypothetical protein